MHDLTGTILADRYQILRRIGQGGFATVHEALDRKLDKTVAVKVLSPRFAAKEEYRRRFVQEARAAARLRHRLLVDVTDHGVTRDGLFFFVMEHLQGHSLGERLREQPGPVPWRQVLAVSLEVARALEVAHQHGIVHRDVKPGNVFLVGGVIEGPDLEVKLLDLGIAKVHYDVPDQEMPETRESQGAPGTPEYMAPEQIQSGAKGPSVDLYAVGVLMYRLLTGALPFSSRTSWEVLRMHVDDPPIPPTTRAPEARIPAAVEAVVLRLMAKRPEDRYASATELRQVLQELLEREPAQPRALLPSRAALFAPERLAGATVKIMRATIAAITLMLATLFTVPAFSDPPRETDHEIIPLGDKPAPSPSNEGASPPVEAAAPPAVNDGPPAEDDVVILDDDDDADDNEPDVEIPGGSKHPQPRSSAPAKERASVDPFDSTPPSNSKAKAKLQKRLQRASQEIASACKRAIPTTITADVEVDLATGAPSVKLRGDRSDAGVCLKKQLELLRFPELKGDGTVSVTERFVL